MSEKMLTVSLSELDTVRVRCKSKRGQNVCGAVFELPIAKLPGIFGVQGGGFQCPFCQQAFGLHGLHGGRGDAFGPLAHAVAALVGIRDRVEIEFVLPVKASPFRFKTKRPGLERNEHFRIQKGANTLKRFS